MTHLIGPGLEHQFPPEHQKRAHAEFGKYVTSHKWSYFAPVRFSTYTLKYNECFGVKLKKLEKHYEQARIDYERNVTQIKVATRNVKAFSLFLEFNPVDPITADVDGVKLEIATGRQFEKVNG